jgi:hypothetical protein
MELTWLCTYLRLRIIVHGDQSRTIIVLSTGKCMESSTGTVHVRDHTRISARTSIHVCRHMHRKLGGCGRRRHDDAQAFSAPGYGTVQ